MRAPGKNHPAAVVVTWDQEANLDRVAVEVYARRWDDADQAPAPDPEQVRDRLRWLAIAAEVVGNVTYALALWCLIRPITPLPGATDKPATDDADQAEEVDQ